MRVPVAPHSCEHLTVSVLEFGHSHGCVVVLTLFLKPLLIMTFGSLSDCFLRPCWVSLHGTPQWWGVLAAACREHTTQLGGSLVAGSPCGGGLRSEAAGRGPREQ